MSGVISGERKVKLRLHRGIVFQQERHFLVVIGNEIGNIQRGPNKDKPQCLDSHMLVRYSKTVATPNDEHRNEGTVRKENRVPSEFRPYHRTRSVSFVGNMKKQGGAAQSHMKERRDQNDARSLLAIIWILPPTREAIRNPIDVVQQHKGSKVTMNMILLRSFFCTQFVKIPGIEEIFRRERIMAVFLDLLLIIASIRQRH